MGNNIMMKVFCRGNYCKKIYFVFIFAASFGVLPNLFIQANGGENGVDYSVRVTIGTGSRIERADVREINRLIEFLCS